MSKFKETYNFEQRKTESAKIIKKYPDMVPAIVEISDGSMFSNKLPELDKSKFLIQKEHLFSQFIFVIRKRMNLEPEKAIFITANGVLVPNTKTMGEIYNDYKDEDNFIYFVISTESVFG